jgi:Flp pilus assembly protein TadB
MDKIDLKSMWQDAHYKNSENNFSKDSLEKTMALKHSKAISKSLLDVKIKVILYTLIFIIYIGLMIYAFVYLRLSLSVNSFVPFALVGIFLLITATSEFVRLLVLTKTADNLSLKDSLLVFCKKLKRIKTTDFIIYMVFFYLYAILIIYNYLTDIRGIKNLSWGNEIVPVPLLIILIIMLLSVPWFIRYQNNRRYKKLFSNLKEAVHLLNDQSGTIGC